MPRPGERHDGFRVRPYREGDAPRLAEVFHRSVREVASADYTPEQVAVWASAERNADFFEARATDGRWVLVAVDASDVVVAYTDLEADGHIDQLYCHPDAAGRGVASALYLELEELARSAGVPRVYVEASEPARRFFERHGFEVIARRDLNVDGVALHNYAMQKSLA